jgi:hypothetical protein
LGAGLPAVRVFLPNESKIKVRGANVAREINDNLNLAAIRVLDIRLIEYEIFFKPAMTEQPEWTCAAEALAL